MHHMYVLSTVYHQTNEQFFENQLNYPIFDKNGKVKVLDTPEIFSKVFQLKSQLKTICLDLRTMETFTRRDLRGIIDLTPRFKYHSEQMHTFYDRLIDKVILTACERTRYSLYLAEKIEDIDKLYISFQQEVHLYNKGMGFITRAIQPHNKQGPYEKDSQKQIDMESD